MTCHALQRLAEAWEVQTSYWDALGQHRSADPAAVVHVLAALGAPVRRPEDASEALRAFRVDTWRRVLEPVIASWERVPEAVHVRLPATGCQGSYMLELDVERGPTLRREGTLEHAEVVRAEEVEGQDYRELRLPLPRCDAWGYHSLRLELPGGFHRARLIVAPEQAFDGGPPRSWGVFAPTYALRGSGAAEAAHLGGLERLTSRVRDLGGAVVGTLPLLASYLDEPFEPSPYAPVSRLFWNELYLDVEALPELAECPRAAELWAAPESAREREELAGADLFDYRRAMALKRPVLAALANHALSGDLPEGCAAFARAHPRAEAYARFRAVVDRQRRGWRSWPAELRAGDAASASHDEADYRYHLYVQWRLDEQLRAVTERLRAHDGLGLYLDLPLGVHPDGFDAWAEPHCFLDGASAGAPPDDFFTRGQSWGFAPLHPRGMREDGYDYVAACLRNQLEHAGMLRIDHVMWMHRIFCVPDGMQAQDGLYVRYRPHELYAVLTLESHRARSVVIGEDLGTVPDEVRETMARRGVRRMYVLQYEVQPGSNPPVRPPPPSSLTSLNTHDMPPFAAFWQERDIDDRIEMGLLDAEGADGERQRRREVRETLLDFLRGAGHLGPEEEKAHAVLSGLLTQLAGTEARTLLINLEDLWLEPLPQNVPGTGPERPNWRRRMRHGIDEAFDLPGVVDTLRAIDMKRRS